MAAFFPARWRRIGKVREAADFLRRREPWCVPAISRFLHPDGAADYLWKWPGGGGGIEALILLHRRILFPVSLGGDFPMPRFLQAFLAKYPLHAIQGPGEDAERLEAMAAELGWRPEEVNNYDLMVMDRPPPALGGGGPPGLLLRRARREDAEGLFPLQAAYEQEEVLPRGAFFDPAVCRLNLDRILAGEQVLAAEIDGRMVGKINTNAASFSRTQIGGVYVRPEYRGRGIALRMAHAFARELIAEGRGLSLFVKKRNAPAQAIYRRIGFEAIGDYRISYY